MHFKDIAEVNIRNIRTWKIYKKWGGVDQWLSPYLVYQEGAGTKSVIAKHQ